MREYDRGLEAKSTAKKEQTLVAAQNNMTLRYSLTDDKILLDLIINEANVKEPTVYITDSVLAAILTVKNSVFPWSVRVTKSGNQYLFDQSDKEKASYIDMLTVNENTNGNLPDEEKVKFNIYTY